ncbi:MAG: hypothetical protein K2I84_00965, partial [Bacteroidales bacterium]|nr:hypothetical protein [Bacteroidales bacterium]
MKKHRLIFLLITLNLLFVLTVGCRHETAAISGATTALPSPVADGFMFPDYGDSIVLPPNIAPLNFSVNEKIHLRVSCGDEKLLDKNYNGQVRFNQKAWK